jgi:HPt (histidine-containing phosphotransfer) domain-containing protein
MTCCLRQLHPFLLHPAEIIETMFQIDEKRALLALDGNRILLMELASMFQEDAPKLLCKIKTAVANESATHTRSAVHSLKGLAATFYAQSTVELANRLEDCAASGQLEVFHQGELQKLEQAIESVIEEFVERGWVTDH